MPSQLDISNFFIYEALRLHYPHRKSLVMRGYALIIRSGCTKLRGLGSHSSAEPMLQGFWNCRHLRHLLVYEPLPWHSLASVLVYSLLKGFNVICCSFWYAQRGVRLRISQSFLPTFRSATVLLVTVPFLSI